VFLVLALAALLSRKFGLGIKTVYVASATIDEKSIAAQPPGPFMAAVATPQSSAGSDAPPPDKTGGFDGKRTYDLVAKQVAFGPRSSGSPAIVQLQNFLESELKGYGCTVESDSFSSDTPAGRLPMKNLLVKIPGERPGILMLATHYDS